MSLDVTGAKILFTIPILGGINITQTTVSLFVVSAILCLSFYFLGRNLQKRPTGRQVIVEKLYMMLQNLVCDAMGKHNAHWTPFIATIFLSSICGSFIGLTGFLRSSTADLAVPLTWAVMVSVIIWAQNIKYNGFVGWLKGFTEPIAVMTPMNLISEVAQPLSMAFRHFGNSASGGIISSLLYTALSGLSAVVLNAISSSGWIVSVVLLALGVAMVVVHKLANKKALLILGIVSIVLGFFGLLQALGLLTGVPLLTFGIPAVLSLYFDLFSGFVQAFVFSLLTMVYISSAIPEPQQDPELR